MSILVTIVRWFSSCRNRKTVKDALHTLYITHRCWLCDEMLNKTGAYMTTGSARSSAVVTSLSRGSWHRIKLNMTLDRFILILFSVYCLTTKEKVIFKKPQVHCHVNFLTIYIHASFQWFFVKVMNILFTYVDLECAFGTNPYNTATDKIDQRYHHPEYQSAKLSVGISIQQRGFYCRCAQWAIDCLTILVTENLENQKTRHGRI